MIEPKVMLFRFTEQILLLEKSLDQATEDERRR